MGLHEDALFLCDNGLKIDPTHAKTKFRKAKCLAMLNKFQESSQILFELGKMKEF